MTSTFLPLVGGAEIAVHNLAAALQSMKHRVVVMAPRFSAAVRHQVPYELRTYPLGTLTLLNQSPPLGHLYALVTLSRLRRERFDVINLHFALPWGPVLMRFKRLLDAPVVLTFRGADLQRDDTAGYGFRRDPGLENRLRTVVRRAEGVVVLSNSMRRAAADLAGQPRQIHVIPNGIDWQRFAQPRPNGRFRRRFGIPDDSPLVLAVGRNHPKKAFPVLIRAMRTVVDEDARTRCVVVGRGTGALSELVASLGLTAHVILVEQVSANRGHHAYLTVPPEEVIEAYKDSTVFVSPSLVEGWPNVVAEALAAGVPAVVTDAPGNRDIVEDGRTGLLCRPQDPEDLAVKILALLADPARRTRLSANALAASRGRDWTEIARRYVETYSTVLYGTS